MAVSVFEPFVYCGLTGNKFSNLFALIGLPTQDEVDIIALMACRFDACSDTSIDAPKWRSMKVPLGGELTDHWLKLVKAGPTSWFSRGHVSGFVQRY